MARIHPFRGWRYDGKRVALQSVVTQPYDKITPEMQDKYYAASPHNLVRIILGKRDSADVPGNDVYSRAAAYLHDWQREGVVVQDAEPSIYRYSQKFTEPGTGRTMERRGFIAAGEICDYNEGVIFRHEQTLAKPKADRLDLLRATRAHFGHIFMLYSDPGQKIEQALSATGEADIDVKDEYGVQHRVWKISDPKLVKLVQEVMADKKLIIADGHHRYETALTYRNERRKAESEKTARQAAGGGNGGGVQTQAAPLAVEAPYDCVMMTFVNMDAEGLVILPTHRVVHSLEGFDAARLIKEAEEYFEVTKAPRDAAALIALLAKSGQNQTVIAAVTARDAFLLRLRPGSTGALLQAFSQRQQKLDVVQLHKVLLEKVLGISEEDMRNQKHVVYFRDAAEAFAKVDKGADVAFLMNAAPMQQVRDIAFAGEVLPQKSTDFFPKMLDGLTIYSVE
ncbi:MAG TPA: DUF1015 domain-containing protein [Terriglobales bacterium]|nr:DUF1015 domain-containing protein [Terriglobales bacterium]